MQIEAKLKALGLAMPNLEDLYRSNPAGAHYVSHFPVQGLHGEVRDVEIGRAHV